MEPVAVTVTLDDSLESFMKLDRYTNPKAYSTTLEELEGSLFFSFTSKSVPNALAVVADLGNLLNVPMAAIYTGADNEPEVMSL